ncbi:MAG: D-alanyl-D-alanine carboxypeptidase [Clostridia bacterium]|nr:D-alanyl-D-alanine carboxypeptidase [Clostridia bacterium]
MEFNEYNEGELETVGDGSRYVTSAHFGDERLSIAIIAAILVLAVLVWSVFALFTEESIPVWNPSGSSGSSSSSSTTTGNGGGGNEPEYPYATKTDKTNFIASAGGDDLDDIYLYSEYAILIKLSDMTTLAHQGADEVIYPASMTKVMTVLVALDRITDLSDGYVIDESVLAQMPDGAANAGLAYYVGRTFSVRDLLYGVSYVSAADSVLCLIDYLNLTVEQFVRLMNEKAAQIGLQNTTFGGPIGMDAEFNQTTCRDVAAIMAYAMENPLCREIFGGTVYELDYLDIIYKNSTLNKNLVNNFISTPETIVGGYTLLAAKSGLEDKAGFCLVSLIKNNESGEEFILVTANAPYANKEPIFDMIELFTELNP